MSAQAAKRVVEAHNLTCNYFDHKAQTAEEVFQSGVLYGKRQGFTQRVAPWMQACFGAEISADTIEAQSPLFGRGA